MPNMSTHHASLIELKNPATAQNSRAYRMARSSSTVLHPLDERKKKKGEEPECVVHTKTCERSKRTYELKLTKRKIQKVFRLTNRPTTM